MRVSSAPSYSTNRARGDSTPTTCLWKHCAFPHPLFRSPTLPLLLQRYSPTTHRSPSRLTRAAAMPCISRRLYHYCAAYTTDVVHFPYRGLPNRAWHHHGSHSIAVPQPAAIVATAPIQTLLASVCVHLSTSVYYDSGSHGICRSCSPSSSQA